MKWSEEWRNTVAQRGTKWYIQYLLWLVGAGICVFKACGATYRVGQTNGALTMAEASTPCAFLSDTEFVEKEDE